MIMKDMKWKYVKALKDADAVEKFEAEYDTKIPADLKEIIKNITEDDQR